MALSKRTDVLAEACAAGIGGLLSTSILYPLDTIKTRIQSSKKNESFADGVEQDSDNVNQPLSVMSLYRGLQYKAAESSVSKFIYFYTYTFLSDLSSANGKRIGTLTDLLLGYLSELSHRPVTIPMELIATKLQTGSENYSSVAEICRKIFLEKGVGGFYRGLNAYIVLGLQPAIQYTLFQRAKDFYLRQSKKRNLGALEAFLLGAIARSIATILLFPYIRAKVMLQANKNRSNGSTLQKEHSIASTLRQIYTEDGIVAIYHGLGPEIMRGALSAALMLMIKEKIHAYINFLFLIANSY